MPSRARKQREARSKHVNFVVKMMYRRLNTEEHCKRMTSTNVLLPLGSLRRAPVRKIFFPWVRKLKNRGRVVTLKLAKAVLKALRARFDLGDPDLNGDEEAKRVHSLLKVAKKRVPNSSVAMSAMDTLVTLPMELPDVPEDRTAVVYVHFISLDMSPLI